MSKLYSDVFKLPILCISDFHRNSIVSIPFRFFCRGWKYTCTHTNGVNPRTEIRYGSQEVFFPYDDNEKAIN